MNSNYMFCPKIISTDEYKYADEDRDTKRDRHSIINGYNKNIIKL